MSIGNVIWAKFDLNISQQNTEHFSINQTRVYLLSYYNTWTKLNNIKQNTYIHKHRQWIVAIENDYNLALFCYFHTILPVSIIKRRTIILTLEIDTTRFSGIEVVWYLLLSWNDAVWLEGILRVVAWRHSGDALLLVWLLGVVWHSWVLPWVP